MGNFNSLYAGKVVDVKDPEKRGRIKVVCSEVTGEGTSAWCEPCVPNATDFGGDFCLPPIDDFVWVMFEEGEPDQPVYLGGWWSKNSTMLGDDYSDSKKIRFINFGDMTIVMNKDDNSITINTTDGEDECEIKVLPNKIKMNVLGGDAEISVSEDKIVFKGNVKIDGNLEITGTTTHS